MRILMIGAAVAALVGLASCDANSGLKAAAIQNCVAQSTAMFEKMSAVSAAMPAEQKAQFDTKMAEEKMKGQTRCQCQIDQAAANLSPQEFAIFAKYIAAVDINAMASGQRPPEPTAEEKATMETPEARARQQKMEDSVRTVCGQI